MDYNEIMKQREIGKQIMIVNIIQTENDIEKRGGFHSYIQIKDLAKWANMMEEEVDNLVYACHSVDTCFVSARGIDAFPYIDKENKDNESRFFFSSCDNLKDIIFDNVDVNNKTIAIDKIVKQNYKKFFVTWPQMSVSEEYADVSVVGDFVEGYICYYVNRIKEILSMGYEWDVVCKMLRYELSRDKYYVLEEHLNH